MTAMSLREALRDSPCPRPANGEPDDQTVGACVDGGNCGCQNGEALRCSAESEAPVAYRCRPHDMNWRAWEYSSDDPRDDELFVEPLYTRPAPSASGRETETAFMNLCEALGLQASVHAYLDAGAARRAVAAPATEPQASCPCGVGNEPCPGPDGKLLCDRTEPQAAPTLSIDDVPSCGQENDYRRAKSQAAPPREEMPEIPDDDTDFTPDLARKIIAKYRSIIATRASASQDCPIGSSDPTVCSAGCCIRCSDWRDGFNAARSQADSSPQAASIDAEVAVQLVEALNDMEISAYNAAKYRIGRALGLLTSNASSQAESE